jgi:hypothetical protein
MTKTGKFFRIQFLVLAGDVGRHVPTHWLGLLSIGLKSERFIGECRQTVCHNFCQGQNIAG